MKKSKLIIILVLMICLCGCEKEKTYEKLQDKIEIGSYVKFSNENQKYLANKQFTGTAEDQTISLDNLTDWMVTKKTNEYIELMSLNVTNDELCIKGKTGYQNYIYVINELSRAFNHSFIIGGRGFGYKNQTEKIEDDSCIEDYDLCKNKLEKYGLGDEDYTEDHQLAKNMGIINAEHDTYIYPSYWVASRGVSKYVRFEYWMGKYVDPARKFTITTEVLYDTMYDDYNEKNREHCHYVRPIVFVNPESDVLSGDGLTKETAVVLK